MKKVTAICLAFFCVIIFTGNANAADIIIECVNEGCKGKGDLYFFPASETWFPGKSLNRTFRIENRSGKKREISVRTENILGNGNLDSVLEMYIRDVNRNNYIWAGSFTDFLNAGEIDLPDISDGENAEYEFRANMLGRAGNIHQGSALTFKLIFRHPAENREGKQDKKIIDSETGKETNYTVGLLNFLVNPASGILTGAGIIPFDDIISPVVLEGDVAGTARVVEGQTGGLPQGQEICSQPLWLYALLALQALISLILAKNINRNILVRKTVCIMGVFLAVLFAGNHFSCSPKIYFIWGSIALLFFTLLRLENRFRKQFEKKILRREAKRAILELWRNLFPMSTRNVG